MEVNLFFSIPLYRKLIKHFCRNHLGISYEKKNYQIIVKKALRILEDQSSNCLVYITLYKNFNSLEDHLE